MYLKAVAVLYVKINYAELISYPADSLSREYISAEATMKRSNSFLLWACCYGFIQMKYKVMYESLLKNKPIG